jgi:hypothetical protein
MSNQTKTVNKSAVTGRFVTDKQVQRSPNTTFKQTVPVVKPGKAK